MLSSEVSGLITPDGQPAETETEIGYNTEFTGNNEPDNPGMTDNGVTENMLYEQEINPPESAGQPANTETVTDDETFDNQNSVTDDEKINDEKTVNKGKKKSGEKNAVNDENEEKILEIDSPDYFGRPIITRQPKRKRLRRKKEDEN